METGWQPDTVVPPAPSLRPRCLQGRVSLVSCSHPRPAGRHTPIGTRRDSMNSQGVQGAPLSVAPEAQHSPLWPAGPTSHRLRLHAFYRMKMRLLKPGRGGGGQGGIPAVPSPGARASGSAAGPSWPPSQHRAWWRPYLPAVPPEGEPRPHLLGTLSAPSPGPDAEGPDRSHHPLLLPTSSSSSAHSHIGPGAAPSRKPFLVTY